MVNDDRTAQRSGAAGWVWVILTSVLWSAGTPVADPQTPAAGGGAVAAQQAVAHPELFGMIEVGAKGVKGIVIDLIEADADPNCQKGDEEYLACVKKSIRKKFDPFNVNAVDRASVQDVANAVRGFADEMRDKYTVDPSQIYLVASSSVSNREIVGHRDELQSAVEAALDGKIPMGFVTPAEEGEYGFQGVLNLIPKKWREVRRKQAVLIDVGSGDTKGGYVDGAGKFNSVMVPWGTKSFANKVNEARGDRAMKDVVGEMKDSVLRPAIRETMASHPGIGTHNRVYLIGGIAWATVNLMDPKSKRAFPEIHPAWFHNLFVRAAAPDAATALCSENKDAAFNPDIAKVCQAFDMNSLMAGSQVLEALSAEMGFAKKKVFFLRDSLYAWPLGYLRARCQAAKKC